MFTELLLDKQKAANGAAVEKGSGKDGNEKDLSCVEVLDEMEEANRPAEKENSRLHQRVKKGAVMMKEANIEDLILAGF